MVDLFFLFFFFLQVVKCGEYFHPEEGCRQFGKICVTTKHMKICDASLVLRYMEVNNQEVRQTDAVNYVK